jgi:hypothetical protein
VKRVPSVSRKQSLVPAVEFFCPGATDERDAAVQLCGLVGIRASVAVCTAVAAAVVGVSGSEGARVGQLEAWASWSHTPVLGVSAIGFRGSLVKHLRAGTYRVSVIATDALGFHLVGPGLDRRTPTQIATPIPEHPTNASWRIRLRPGLYKYSLVGPSARDFPYQPAVRSFRVP